jgi:Asp-tRNA(Asn)/Glu-tRNA(Gln) amidotransferase A subunit family amidase
MKTGADPIHAWVEVLANPDPPLPGALHGVEYGAKDIFETRGITTEYGSPLYKGRKGDRDAWLITRLRELGAVLVGKTHTTAFASFDPAPTLNPRMRGHTPGGSSSGSAAAVAAGMVRFAIGTQTLGSVIRPASFCGVCGFKPTFGRIPFDGALPFAPSLDTVGFFTATAAEMEWLWTRSFGAPCDVVPHRAARLRVPCDPPMRRAIDDAISRLRAHGMQIDEVDPPSTWTDLISAAFLVNRYQGARTHRERYAQFGERLGPRLCELIRAGLAIEEDAYNAAVATVDRHRSIVDEHPIILSPAAPGAPPAGLASTGDPSCNAAWTALGVPAITIPLPGETPLGLQITAARQQEDLLIASARLIADS